MKMKRKKGEGGKKEEKIRRTTHKHSEMGEVDSWIINLQARKREVT